MPTKQNNSGFGYLPVLIISALVISGTYFGYSWYSSNSNQEIEKNIAESSNQEIVESDVLQSTSTTKIPANFNPDKLPIAWSYIDSPQNGTWNMYLFITGLDAKKLETAVNNLRNSKLQVLTLTPKPCIPNGNRVIMNEYSQEVTKLTDEFYLITTKGVNTYAGTSLDKTCQIGNSQRFLYRGLNYDQFVWALKGMNPLPASILYPSQNTSTSPNRRLNSAQDTSQRNIPAYKLPVDLSKMKLDQK